MIQPLAEYPAERLFVRVAHDRNSFTYLEGDTANSVTVIIEPGKLYLVDVKRSRYWNGGHWGALEQEYPAIAKDTELRQLAVANCVP